MLNILLCECIITNLPAPILFYVSVTSNSKIINNVNMKMIMWKGLLFFSLKKNPCISDSVSFGWSPRSGVSRSEYKHIKDWQSITKLFSKSIVPIYISIESYEILLNLC